MRLVAIIKDIVARILASDRRWQCSEGDEKQSTSGYICKVEPIRFVENTNV